MQGLGGGNCQISSTLYSRFKPIPSLKVAERHKHSNKSSSCKKRKRGVAVTLWKVMDFEISNNSGNDIKLTLMLLLLIMLCSNNLPNYNNSSIHFFFKEYILLVNIF